MDVLHQSIEQVLTRVGDVLRIPFFALLMKEEYRTHRSATVYYPATPCHAMQGFLASAAIELPTQYIPATAHLLGVLDGCMVEQYWR